MRCLVTGGAGFIGSNLVHELVKQGHKVDVVDNFTNGFLENLDSLKTRVILSDLLGIYEDAYENERSEDQVLVVEGNFSSTQILKRIAENKYDVVFHLAANPRVEYSVRNPIDTTETNLFDSIYLCEAIKNGGSKTRLVFSSTCAVYGNPSILPVKEAAEKNPESPYGWQKSSVEDFLRFASKLYDLDSIALRYFNVYGPRQRGGSPYSTAISAWCDKVSSGQPLRFDGDGTQTRDMVHVDDVVQANILAAESKNRLMGDVVNIGTGIETSNKQIIEMFKNRFSNLEINFSPKRLGDVDHVYADVQRAFDLLGFKAKVDLKTGLEKTFSWWKL